MNDDQDVLVNEGKRIRSSSIGQELWEIHCRRSGCIEGADKDIDSDNICNGNESVKQDQHNGDVVPAPLVRSNLSTQCCKYNLRSNTKKV
jgi:hypothetical protein